MKLPESFTQLLEATQVIKPRERVLLACSGGPDSVALFHLLRELQPDWKLKLGVVSVHHGLRGKEATGDVKFVKKLCEKYKIPFYTSKIDVKKRAKKDRESVEEAARHGRYEAIIKIAKRGKYKKIALAHNLDDQAETVMMRVLQGTGLRGLLGIRRRVTQGGKVFVRPLLDFQKKDILKYLKKNKFKYRKDSTNESTRFVRNRIRKKLIPWLEKEINPRVLNALARIPDIISDESSFLEKFEQDSFDSVLLSQKKSEVNLSRAKFRKLAPSIQFRVLNRALHRVDAKSAANFDAWNRIRPSLSRKTFRYSFPKDVDLSLSPSKIKLYRK